MANPKKTKDELRTLILAEISNNAVCPPGMDVVIEATEAGGWRAVSTAPDGWIAYADCVECINDVARRLRSQYDLQGSPPAPSPSERPAGLAWQGVDSAGQLVHRMRRNADEFSVGPTHPPQASAGLAGTGNLQASADLVSPATNLQRNRVAIVLNVDALLLLIEEKLARIREERLNEDPAPYEGLKLSLEALRGFGLQQGKADENAVVAATNTFIDGIQSWWEKDHERICEKTFEAAIFVSCVGLRSLFGCGGAVTVAVSGVIAGGKPVMEVLKGLGKKLLK